MVEPISTSTLIRLGIFGARAAGFNPLKSIFGEDSDRDINLPALSIPENLRTSGIPGGAISASSFRRFGPQIVAQSNAISSAFNTNVVANLRAFGFPAEDITSAQKAFAAIGITHATSPSDAFRRNQQAANLTSFFIDSLDQFRIDNPSNIGVRRQRKGPDTPKGPPGGKSPIEIGDLARLALNFVPRGRPKRLRTGRAGGFTFAEQAKEQDLIIPPGFTSKQPTTLSRAIDPNILSGVR
ncbi:hypothetical protein LCGC14_1392190 [marine sediment metagenome]|uniref:Uncharacterized protein n=1 Tax=marine sediment metagenome TaxID=412755 RepID=A0A0F9JZS4_9ZZZZ|nr:hypothetical protein [Candidatus Aminicenantes bacterium]